MPPKEVALGDRTRLEVHFSVFVAPSPNIHSHAPARANNPLSRPVEEHGRRWAQLWEENEQLPWDRGFPSPALQDLLSERSAELGLDNAALVRAKHALVPGCGKGYDAMLFASYGLNSTGLEIAPDAVQRARAVAAQGLAALSEEEKAKYGELKFVTGDFYKADWAREEGYDYVYDYTVSPLSPALSRPRAETRLAGQ